MSKMSRWLQPPSKDSLEQQYQELANLLRAKERLLETTSHDLKVKTAAMQVLEQKVMSSETQFSSAQRELTARGEQLKALEAELALRSRRVADLEAEGVAARQHASELNAIIATQGDDLRGAQQAREVLKEEIRVLRDHVTQLNEGLADRDQVRARMEKLESAQDRVHLLEVELSDREAAHRRRIQQLEQVLAERDRRIGEFDAAAAAQLDELRGAQQASQTAEQAREVLKEEIRVLRDHIAQLNEGLADREHLRAQAKQLEAVQIRVNQLHVELSDRESAHRSAIQQLEQALAERDRRIGEFDVVAAAQMNELRGAQQAGEVLKEEIRVLRDHITQLNEGLADRDQVRARMEKLESAQDRVHRLEIELSDRESAHRSAIQQLEQALAERDRRIGEFNAAAAAQLDEVRGAQQACHTAEQAREVLKEEIRVLRDHIAQLNENLADRDRLRTQVKKLESVQARVHQLEVELSDREAAHRGTIQQLEQALTERDRRIEELMPVTYLLREKEATIKEWERTHARTVQELEAETAKLQEQWTAQEQLRAQHELDEQHLQERDEQIAHLQRELHDLQAERHALQTEVQCIPGKDEQIDRLQKRLKELRTSLRATPASATVLSHKPRQNGAGSDAPVRPPKVGKSVPEDDLKKIYGIGPGFAQTLQKLGTRTFIQIARWKPEDIEKIAKKLDTDPDRIKRENWIADAKKQHYRKYGERI
ncbi:MAG: hypothetical protein A4E19_13150 [Nitrospira sp. SG-bin1]|nr:MAG: hypothetical protein A4E19_13150 [Nitrospira sp. SG-bin1]